MASRGQLRQNTWEGNKTLGKAVCGTHKASASRNIAHSEPSSPSMPQQRHDSATRSNPPPRPSATMHDATFNPHSIGAGRSCIETDHQLERLRISVQQQRSRLDDLSEEYAALRDCLENAGSLCPQSFQIHLHRRNFRAAKRKYPTAFDRTLPEVLQTHILDVLTARCAGFAATRELRATSRVVSQATARALHSMGPAPSVAYLLGGWDGTNACADAHRFNPTTGSWEILPPMQERRCSTAAAVCCGQVYVLGGDDGSRPLDSVERFNAATDQWEVLPSMLERRQGSAAIAVMGQVYVLGGHDGRRCLASAERFDPGVLPANGRAGCAAPSDGSGDVLGSAAPASVASAAGVWEALPPLAERRQSVAATALAGQIYAMGGFDGNRTLSSAERLDLTSEHSSQGLPGQPVSVGIVAGTRVASNASSGRPDLGVVSSHASLAWAPLVSMTEPRMSSAAATLGGGVYVIGGFNGTAPLRSVERFDPTTSVWLASPSMVQRRVGPSVASIAGVLYAFGGRQSEHLLGCGERFDLTVGLWKRTESLPHVRVYASAVSARL